MLCASCKTEIPLVFKYAITKNECPSCGKTLMDEETLAMIEDVSNTISQEVLLRGETLNKIALSIVTKYDLSGKVIKKEMEVKETVEENKEEDIKYKIAPPSIAKQAEEDLIVNKKNKIKEHTNDENIVELSSISDKISNEERENIMEQVVKERYNMVDGINPEDIEENNE